MGTEQKEKLAGLPDSMHQWAQVCVPVLLSPGRGRTVSTMETMPTLVFPFWGMLQDCCIAWFCPGLSCLLTLPWLLVAHMATYLGIYSFLSFLGTRQAQAAHSACTGLAWEGCSYIWCVPQPCLQLEVRTA